MEKYLKNMIISSMLFLTLTVDKIKAAPESSHLPTNKSELIAEVQKTASRCRDLFGKPFAYSCLWDGIKVGKCLLHPFQCRKFSKAKDKFTIKEYYGIENERKIFVSRSVGNMLHIIEQNSGDFKKLAVKISEELQALASGCKNMANGLNLNLAPMKELYLEINGKACWTAS